MTFMIRNILDIFDTFTIFPESRYQNYQNPYSVVGNASIEVSKSFKNVAKKQEQKIKLAEQNHRRKQSGKS